MKLALYYGVVGSLFSAVVKTTNASISATTAEVSALVDSLLAPEGAMINSATLTGNAACAGLFTGGSLVDPGIPDSGVILSSGDVAGIAGPNDQDDFTTEFNEPGDDDLDSLIPGYSTNDACILEIDFQCPEGLTGSDLTFNYVFASEEYNEYVGSSYNDVFGWFLNGANIAFLPDGSSTPVAINNVNNDANAQWYNNNDLDDLGTPTPFNIQADGFTTTLIAAAPTIDGSNKIKLAIADAGDFILDSWVLIESGSFKCTDNLCGEFKGCHDKNLDKRAICHRNPANANTLCLPAEAIAAHLAEHPEDSCGCCPPEEEKRQPEFCPTRRLRHA